MLKIILLLSLIPFLVAVALRKIFYKPTAEISGKKAQLTLEKLLAETLPPEVIVEYSSAKKVEFKKGVLVIPEGLRESRDLTEQLDALETVGLLQLGKGKDIGLRQHASLLLFDTLFPTFASIAILFGFLARSIPPNLALALFIGILGLTALNNLYLTWLRHQALQIVKHKVDSLPLYMKREDASCIQKELKSRPYKYVIPRLIVWIL